MDWMALGFALAIALGVAWIAKRIPKIVLDIAMVIMSLWLLSVFFATFGVNQPEVWIEKIPYLKYIIAGVVGLSFGRLLWRWLPF